MGNGKVKKSNKRVTAKQAARIANLMKLNRKKAAPMDAEDMIDHGVDEAKEKN